MRDVSIAVGPVRMIGRTFALLQLVTFALLSIARSALAVPTLEITTPQGCGPGVMVGPTVPLIVRATGIAPGSSVGVHILEYNVFNQRFGDTAALSHDLPERTVTKLSGSPFPRGNVLITAQIVGQTDVVSCQLTVAGDGTPTSTAQPTSTPLNASPTQTLTTTITMPPTPSVTPTPSVAAGPDGDANCDGRVTAADPTRELVLLLSHERAPCIGDDANHDGVLTPVDFALTASLLFDQ